LRAFGGFFQKKKTGQMTKKQITGTKNATVQIKDQ
jgi:hypothetical protein